MTSTASSGPDVLRRTALHGSYHHADRTITTEIALHGPFYQVPDWLYFRRDHPERAERACPTVRTRCANMDPRRADRLRNPAVRLYGEYILGYVAAIRRAPLSSADRRECYRHLAQWADEPGLGRGPNRHAPASASPAQPVISVDTVVAGQERRPRDLAGIHRRRQRSTAAAPRVGLFGVIGTGNIGNEGMLEAVLSWLRADHPDAILDVMCIGPERVKAQYGAPAIPLNWYQKHEQASGVTAIVLRTLGKGIDAFRMASWVRQHDVVIVPGAGVLEATLPVGPWWYPYAMFLLCASGRAFGTKVAMVSVGR